MTFRRICVLVLLFLLTAALFPSEKLRRATPKIRKAYLRQAKIWHWTDIPKTNFLAGIKSHSEVVCHYIEPKHVSRGFSPKFECKLLGTGEVLRVKYDTREIFGELAGSHLLLALGFYADENYPARIRCLGCPHTNPSQPSADEPREERTIDNAMIERQFPGEEIEEFDDQGWNWNELKDMNHQLGGATEAEVEALKLIAVFIQHMDSKNQQQRLGCYEEDITRMGNLEVCRQPILMIQDLGLTFGLSSYTPESDSTMYLKGWQSQKIWNEQKEADARLAGHATCFGNLTSMQSEGLKDPEISEAGRVFLANLLNQLSHRQIRDLFVLAHANKTGETIFIQDRQVPVTIEDWVSAFEEKRRQINEHHCQ